MSARTLVSPASDSQCLPTPMLLLYSPRTPGQCPQCLMSVEMVVRRRRRDTGIRYLLPSLLTPGLSQGTTKDSLGPPAAAAGLTSLRIHSMVSRPAPLRLTTLSPSLTQTHLSGVSTQSLLTTEH